MTEAKQGRGAAHSFVACLTLEKASRKLNLGGVSFASFDQIPYLQRRNIGYADLPKPTPQIAALPSHGSESD